MKAYIVCSRLSLDDMLAIAQAALFVPYGCEFAPLGETLRFLSLTMKPSTAETLANGGHEILVLYAALASLYSVFISIKFRRRKCY